MKIENYKYRYIRKQHPRKKEHYLELFVIRECLASVNAVEKALPDLT